MRRGDVEGVPATTVFSINVSAEFLDQHPDAEVIASPRGDIEGALYIAGGLDLPLHPHWRLVPLPER